MSVTVVHASAALENFRHSPVSHWPNRGDEVNRIEPLAMPALDTTFRIQPGATVFTIGSCFARNVETALEKHGFVVPTRRFWTDGAAGKASDNWMLDNYGVPAILNEIAWAFGELPFDPHANFVELRPGLFADMHLPGRIPLEPFDSVMARRERIFEVTRSLLTADVLVMTLGLAEVWRDNRTGSYLNTRPHQATIKADMDRFTLHVLSYEEVHDYLARTFEIVFRRCRPELRVVLTVSPVPMTATYSGRDVAVANQYSKAVLRTATEAIVRGSDRIDYFPSYESVVLSDRGLAWADDQVHVRPALVEHNVGAMIEAYTGQRFARATEAPALPTASDHAAIKAAQSLLRNRRYEEAIAAAVSLRDGAHAPAALRVEATANLRLGRLEPAETAIRNAITLRFNEGGLHGVLGEILLKREKTAEAEHSFELALRYSPDSSRWNALLEQARLLREES